MIGALVLLLAVSVTLTILTIQSFQTASLDEAIQNALVAETQAMTGIQVDDWEIEHNEDHTLHIRVRVQSTQTMSDQDAADLQSRIAERLHRPVALVLSLCNLLNISARTLPGYAAHRI